ncbi:MULTISPECIES: ferredoxin [unclassified Nocardia]|uniref:ferredoxin n=1 Tax=unclassified Nocardia TaxID=2637762 RepID=UPI001CE43517|nr:MULTISPECIES: ferredoxin [unclassified Nocardia]
MRIIADREICVGAGMCALTAPENFDQDTDEGRVLVLDENPAPDRQEAVRQAVLACPSGAITIAE